MIAVQAAPSAHAMTMEEYLHTPKRGEVKQQPAEAATTESQDDPAKHAPDLGSDILILKKPFTMKACTDRVADVVRNHTGAGLRIDPLPSGTGLIGEDIDIVIRCVPNLKAIIFMAAGSNRETVGQTLTFYGAVFEFEVKQIGDGK
jgi:hypothetical protein